MKDLKLVGSTLACLILASCGGGGDAAAPAPASASISGTVTGLPTPTLLLNNAGAETIAVAADGSFSFAKRVAEGGAYNVTVLGEPNGTTCNIANGKGTVAHGMDSVSNVQVTCVGGGFMTPFTVFHVGVTVSGLLPGNSVTFVNDQNEALTAGDNGLYVFTSQYSTASVTAGKVAGYEVTVKTQPSNQSCAVTGASGTGANASDFVDLPVSCN